MRSSPWHTATLSESSIWRCSSGFGIAAVSAEEQTGVSSHLPAKTSAEYKALREVAGALRIRTWR